ncbi:MAG: Regulatory protein BlaR1 [Firmicutes bacterium ADurb.Bin182]|nr:MAG: Regulatory protein BlaR1 [Firmicutes bacterium ADurb.Bin182]
MFENVFIAVLNMSITASYAAVFIILLRLLLKKAPKSISYALWSVVLLRAICPVSFSSVISLFGRLGTVNTAAGNGTIRYIPENMGMSAVPAVNVGIANVNIVINESLSAATPTSSVNPMQLIITAGMIIWLIGAMAMMAYSIIAYIVLRRRISTAVHIENNIYESDLISTAFVCGFIKPRIYLPVGMDENSRSFVLAHERIHIRRRDHLIKPAAFLVLSMHWFNPFMWAAYFLMGKDMEMSCDERVLKSIGLDEKANYGTALLTLSAGRRIIAGSPLAFGESNTRSRVKNVLNYRKPAFWMAFFAIALVAAVGVSLLANPKTPEPTDLAPEIPAVPDASPGEEQPATPFPTVTTDIPDGFIINAAGAADSEVSAIFAVEKNSLYIQTLAEQDIHLYIYARQDWHDGALILAGVSPRGETAPELYFINSSGAVMRTSGSDCWSINYTHYEGETIVFGKSFAWDNGPLATDEVRAEFWGTEAVSVPMEYIPNEDNEITRGFICTTPSVTWLKSLKILRDGKTVTDDGSGQFIYSPENEPWYGEAESIRNRTRYVWMSDALPAAQKINVLDFFGGYPSVTVETGVAAQPSITRALTYWPDCSAHKGISPDIWHSNNGLYDRVSVKAGSKITAEVSAVTDDSQDHQKVSDLAISKIYWADLSINSDDLCITEGELVSPAKKGYYVLVLYTDYGYFSQTVRVV